MDSSENLILTGTFGATIDADPGVGAVNLTSAGMTDIFIISLNASGNYIWSGSIGGPNNERPYAVAVNSSSVYLGGYFETTSDLDPTSGVSNFTSFGSRDGFVVQLDLSGNFNWAKQIAGTDLDYVSSIVCNEQNEIYIAGSFLTNIDVDPSVSIQNLTAIAGQDSYVVSLDSNGNLLQSFKNGGSGSDNIFDLAFALPNELYLVGSIDGNIDFNFGPGNDNYSTVGNADAYVLKTKTNLNSYAIINVSSCSEFISPSGNYAYSTNGSYNDTIPNNAGADSVMTINYTNLSSSSAINITACELYQSPSGNYLYTSSGTYQDTITNFNGCDSIITINLIINDFPDVSVIQTGTSLSAVTTTGIFQWVDCNNSFNQISGANSPTYNVTTNGSYAVVINNNGCIDTSTCIKINDVSTNHFEFEYLSIYPNPSSGKFNIVLDKTYNNITVKILDNSGKIVQTENVVDVSKLEINIEAEQGIYFIEVIADEFQISSILIKI